jgi:diacylglycerol kinase family enzyme
MKRILLIYNPRAGKGKIKHLLADIIELWNRNYYEVVVYPTKCKFDATRIIKHCLNQQEEFQYVVCCGGDGTLNEVVNSIMSLPKKPKIGKLLNLERMY